MPPVEPLTGIEDRCLDHGGTGVMTRGELPATSPARSIVSFQSVTSSARAFEVITRTMLRATRAPAVRASCGASFFSEKELRAREGPGP